MHRFAKRTVLLLLAVVMLASLCVSAFAAVIIPDITRTDCSVTLFYLDNNGDPIQGGGFTLYNVASVKNHNNNLFHDISGTQFAKSGIAVDNLESDGLAQMLALYAEKNKLVGIEKPIPANGELKFDDLTVGLYLIVQTKVIPGYYSIEPFLVTVPIFDKNSNEWVYQVNANIKNKVNPKPAEKIDVSVKKIWADDGENRPKYITVQLIRGDIAYEQIVLSDQNNWTYKWNELDGAYSWSVREINVPNGYTVTYYTIGNETIITNTSSLIQTGQLNWPIPWLAGMGLILFSIGWVITFAKKEKKSDA